MFFFLLQKIITINKRLPRIKICYIRIKFHREKYNGFFKFKEKTQHKIPTLKDFFF